MLASISSSGASPAAFARRDRDQEADMSLDFFLGLFPKLVQGTWITILLVVLVSIFGNALAVGVALARVSKNPCLWMPSYLYILLMRGTPLLVQIYFLYYGCGSILAHTPLIRHSIFWPYLR